MVRMFLMAMAIAFFVALGCGRKQPAAAPANEPANALQVEIPAAQPVKAAAPQASVTQAASKPEAANSSRVRDLVNQYLESDGKGGWLKNEQAATELEKLTAEETAQLWPLLKDQQVNVRRGAA